MDPGGSDARDSGAPAPSFDRSVLDAIQTIRATVDTLEMSVEAIDLKLAELFGLQAERSKPALLSSPALLTGSRPPSPERHDARSDRPAGAPRTAFETLKDVLKSIPSRHGSVNNVYDEIKAFVALNVAVVDDVTPTVILDENLLPYLRASSSSAGRPSLHTRIWGQMMTIAGLSASDTKRALKRLIDAHYRTLKRKPSPIDSVPASMLSLADTLRSGGFARHEQHADVNADPDPTFHSVAQ